MTTVHVMASAVARTVGYVMGLTALLACIVHAQPARKWSDHAPHRRSVDVALDMANGELGGGDWGYVGLSAQYVAAPRRWVLVAAQSGVTVKGPSGDICYLRPDGGCYEGPAYQWYLSPLVGTGVRAGALSVRAFVGPRVTLAGPVSRLGVQANADVTIGGKRVAFYIPLTWAAMGGGADRFEARGAGLGLQFR